MTHFAQRSKWPKKLAGNFGFFRSYVEKAAAIHALTEGEAEQIQDAFKTKKIITVPNGVKDELFEVQEKFSPVDLAGFENNRGIILGFVGRLDVYIKGLDLLLKALEKVKTRLSESACKLLVVGPFFTNRDRKRFFSMVKRLALENMVKSVGPKYEQEKWRYFLACDVYAQTSRTEGMPMSVLEAMALGRPCLVTLGTNMGPLVHDAGGWQCQPNPESIFEAIKSIYESKDSFKTLGQRARELIKARFTWRKVAQELGEKYMEIIKEDN
jgi:glycosyltransferase involved in cell wall biosynthesis